jgi:hypothetical protein
MHEPDKPAIRNVHHDVLNGLEGMVRMGYVVNEKKKARDHLDDEPGEGTNPRCRRY